MKIITKEEVLKKMAKGKDIKDIYMGNLNSRNYDNRFLMYHISQVNINRIMAEDAIFVDIESSDELTNCISSIF